MYTCTTAIRADYGTLGVCDPPQASHALAMAPEEGLPPKLSMVIREAPSDCVVARFLNPEGLGQPIGDAPIEGVADEALQGPFGVAEILGGKLPQELQP